MATLTFDPQSLDDYRKFLAVKSLPSWRIRGRQAEFPDEYAEQIFHRASRKKSTAWQPLCSTLFDYQLDIAGVAIRKRKFAVFADCGLGKTMILLEFVQAAMREIRKQGQNALIVSPLMVVKQTSDEAEKFYPGLEVDVVGAANLQEWLNNSKGRIGLTNYDAIREGLRPGRLGALVLDESSMLKSHYGRWGTRLIALGKGLDWKLCSTGTPAPNDRIEYANHAVFLDVFPTINSFLSTYFINRGQTQERWILKNHALGPFYRSLSHWCIFLSRPEVYGWKDNSTTIPPIYSHIHHVDLTSQQRAIVAKMTGQLIVSDLGGISSRAKFGQIAKGYFDGSHVDTLKPAYIRSLIESWPQESTLVWCQYNEEQKRLERELQDAASITGSTPLEKRLELIDAFKSGDIRTMITKPKILGFGINLHVATRQVFSGINDSWESYYQCVKRSNRVGSTRPLNVHLPVTEIEEPMIANVLRKAHRVEADTLVQERMFKEYGLLHIGQ